MIKIKLDEVLKDKNVSLTELSEAVDITIANLS
ncbi:transcriptional regulator, partial [Escherichia coli]|nr:transcriptional regulator [Escherichia coli]